MALVVGRILKKNASEADIARTFEEFVMAKVNPAIAVGGPKAELYLQHLKVILGELGNDKLAQLKEA